MKKVIFGLVAAIFLITGSIFVIAQKTADKDGNCFGPVGHGHRGGIEKALRGLDLTAEQKSKVKEIMETSRASIQPLMEQSRANHERMRGLGSDGNFDQAQIETIAADQGRIAAKMIVEKGRIKAQIFAILTDEQKAKAETMRTKFEEKFKTRKAAGKIVSDREL